MKRRLPYSGTFLMASEMVFTVPLPFFETTTSACNADTGRFSNLLSRCFNHIGKLSSRIAINRLLFCMGTPEKSSPVPEAEKMARQLLTNSDKSLRLLTIWSLTVPEASAKPSAQVSWLVSAALSHVNTLSEDDEVRGLTAPLEGEGATEVRERATASTESSRSSRQSL